MGFRRLQCVLFVTAIAAPALPSADSGSRLREDASKSPYVWRVVLDARPHPLLDAAFRAKLRGEIAAALRPALGPLGTVDVIDLAATPRETWEPLWAAYADRGWAALDPDAARELGGVKTHVLRVEVRDGAFHLEARQHDGFTGLASPAVRRQVVRAPELVGRVAGLLLDRDFGVEGTVEPDPARADEATVRFRAGALGPLARHVAVGDVFAVAAVRRLNRPPAAPVRTATGRVVAPAADPPPAFAASPRAHTFLVALAAPADGAVRCKVVTHFQTALPVGGGFEGYRALKLATTEAPLAVRLVNRDGSTPREADVLVRANDAGFGAEMKGRDGFPFRDGLYRSPRPLANLAYVTVAVGATRSEIFPVPVVGPDPVPLRFDLTAADDLKARFERECLDAVRRVGDARAAQAACFEAVARLITARKNADALARAKAGLVATAADDADLTAELQRLRTQAASSPDAAGLLAAGERQLGDVRAARDQLATRTTELEAVVAREADPARVAKETEAQALVTRIKTLLEQGDGDEALATYNTLITLVPDAADVVARRDKLKAKWTPKDDEHARAREFVTKTWPGLASISDLKDGLPGLKAAAKVCAAADDRLAFRKLLPALTALPVRLTDLVAPLDPSAEGDRKLLADAKEVRDAAATVEADVRALLSKPEEP